MSLNQYIILLIGIIFLMNCKEKNNQTPTPANLSRPEVAIFEKETILIKKLKEQNIDFQKMELFLRAFKAEEILEVWARNQETQTFKKVIEYEFCTNSGTLGPKRKEGDRQIPEGVYHINRFNPKSKFYLSLGLNYPNRSDKVFADAEYPGSDIFIHGGCASVGCISITDEKIKELWVLTNEAKKNGQNMIEVHVFPMKMTDKNLEVLINEKPENESFWKNLQSIFESFEKEKRIPSVRVNGDGMYYLI